MIYGFIGLLGFAAGYAARQFGPALWTKFIAWIDQEVTDIKAKL